MNRIGNLLSPFVKSLGIEGTLKLGKIGKEWTHIFNEPLSLHMAPVRLQNGELLIHVDSPVWLQQVSFYKADIVRKLQPFDVKSVRFKLGKVTAGRCKRTDNGPSSARPVTLDRNSLDYIEGEVSVIADLALKDTVRKAMKKALSRKIIK